MATKKVVQKTGTKPSLSGTKLASRSDRTSTTPQFPYTSVPNVLKKMLQEIPKRPKPPKLTRETLKVWGVSADNSSDSAIRVLKKIGLLDESGQPKAEYAIFMDPAKGAQVLGALLQTTYRALFETTTEPLRVPPEELKTFFNVHSGGGEDAMRYQIQTFKALAEFAAPPGSSSMRHSGTGTEETPHEGGAEQQLPPIRVDLHIHLPESKSARDYEAIIQDIAKYIYGRDVSR